MRKCSLILLVIGLIAIGLALLALNYPRDKDMRQIVEDSYSEQPFGDLAYAWVVCIEGYTFRADQRTTRLECDSWTAQGVTSSLVALNINGELVPVVESWIADIEPNGQVIVDITGGPAGLPFHSDREMTDEIVAAKRQGGKLDADLKFAPNRGEYQLMKRGFTIASVGYWGTLVRTYDAAGEFELASKDVRTAIYYYGSELGQEPPLVTLSLGNHLALSALGKERLEGMNVLALVPVMDGLQHHLTRVMSDLQTKPVENEAWGHLNVFKKVDAVPVFNHSQVLALHEYFPKYLGDADFPWTDVSPQGRCSTIVLGRKDPRTRDYIERLRDLPVFVQVWDTDHYLTKDAPDRTRKLYADFADCLLAKPD